jgi:hypothetical protein
MNERVQHREQNVNEIVEGLSIGLVFDNDERTSWGRRAAAFGEGAHGAGLPQPGDQQPPSRYPCSWYRRWSSAS